MLPQLTCLYVGKPPFRPVASDLWIKTHKDTTSDANASLPLPIQILVKFFELTKVGISSDVWIDGWLFPMHVKRL